MTGTDPPGYCFDCAIAIGRRPKGAGGIQDETTSQAYEAEEELEPQHVEARYAALRFIATVLRALAWAVLTLGFIGSLIAAVSIPAGIEDEGVQLAVGVAAFIGGLLWTALTAVILFALADLIFVLLDIEDNTRDAAENTLGLWEDMEKRQRPLRRRRR
jgi:hypothetical protein